MNNKILETLLSKKDEKYKEFICRLMPNVAPETVIGVRTPEMRAIAKQIFGTKEAEKFISELPHKYYEEYGVHIFLINRMKNSDEILALLDKLLPYINNWASCDSLKPKALAANDEKFLRAIKKWIKSDETYTARFAMEMLMNYYLDEKYSREYAELVASVKSDEYYINMMRAWYFATALAKQYESAVQYLENNILDAWTHNKTISKATESFRIPEARKQYLRNLRR